MHPHILLSAPLPDEHVAILSRKFAVHRAAAPDEIEAVIRDVGKDIKAVITIGQIGVSPEQMAAMPALGLIMLKGAGHEGVDLEAARSRGIAVTTGGGTNAVSVADHAMGLMLAVARGIAWADKRVRERLWSRSREPRPLISEKRLGIVGLGRIGRLVAKRAAAGFDMEVAYHGRTRREDVGYEYMPSVAELAGWSDFLVLCCPGGAATRGIIDRGVLRALGPQGFLINVARASVVQPDDLIEALQANEIAGAALDLWEGEPDPDLPRSLLEMPNVVLSPHMGARSPETSLAAIKRIADNLDALENGSPLTGRVA